MLAFRETVVAFADIRSVLAQLRVFGEPVEASINTLQVAVSLGFVPCLFRIATDIL